MDAARAGVAALLLASLPRPAAAGPASAFPLVARAVTAACSLSFAARQDIVMSPPRDAPRARPTRIVADVLQANGRMRLNYLRPVEAAHRVVVDDGHTVRQWEPAQRVILVDQSHEETPETQRTMLRLLHRNYRCAFLRRTVVNGYPCHEVAVRPRRGHTGPSRRLWVEDARHAVLRTEEFDTAGTRRYLSYYETFHYVAPPAARRFALPKGMRVCRVGRPERAEPDPHAAFAAAKVAGRQPCWLPEGYALIGTSLVPGHAGQCVLLRYGDGLKMLSVVEETGGASAPAGPPPQRAGMQVWEMTAAPLRVTVIGDATLPGVVGKEILAALRPQSAARLRQGLASDFGLQALPLAAHLRREGWAYDGIAALCLSLRAQHKRPCWPLPSPAQAPPARMEGKARRWVAATLDRRPWRSEGA